MDSFDPYRFDSPDSYALKTGDFSTGGLTDPGLEALPNVKGATFFGHSHPLSKIEAVAFLIGALAFLGVAFLSM